MLPVSILDGRLVDGGAQLTIEVGAREWETVDMVMLFHLQWDKRNEGEIVEGGDVRIELSLDPELVGELAALVDGTDVARGVAGLDRAHPIKSTEAWYARSVTERVPLPSELAGKGEVWSGFTTFWEDMIPRSDG